MHTNQSAYEHVLKHSDVILYREKVILILYNHSYFQVFNDYHFRIGVFVLSIGDLVFKQIVAFFTHENEHSNYRSIMVFYKLHCRPTLQGDIDRLDDISLDTTGINTNGPSLKRKIKLGPPSCLKDMATRTVLTDGSHQFSPAPHRSPHTQYCTEFCSGM